MHIYPSSFHCIYCARTGLELNFLVWDKKIKAATEKVFCLKGVCYQPVSLVCVMSLVMVSRVRRITILRNMNFK